ncbi:glycoside hydrolase family 3 C-terminal domain-containing protein [Streptomyces sp. NPDC088910]|uniref:glycoside hydrolase family 3 C-terminal domain-containing protein n=1 Tax=Streptomyces sp. NPDC088910 TaxID=3365911 RepID=UPI003818A70E
MSTTPVHDRPPFRDAELPLRERVEDLLGRLTPDERVALLHQYAPAVPRLGIAAFRTGTEALHGVAWLGTATTFPQAVGLGATWDEELTHAVATAVSVEQRAFHHHRAAPIGAGPISLQAWAPVVNLLRDPRWGRNEEGYAEDPLLTARLGDAYCRGMAGDDPEHLRTAPILKHFLAYNNEDDRCVTSSGLRPRVLHEYDLAAFRPAVASGAATGAMLAYNLVNGRPCHVSPLIESELRRWAAPTGHELFVVSDAEAPSNLVDPEHYFTDHAESHAAALRAGVDSFTDHGEDSAVTVGRLQDALRRGLIDEDDVTRAVRRQLAIRFRLGEFDPERDPYAAIGWDAVDSPAHRELALRAATEAVVLLKNDGTLPLEPVAGASHKVAVIGPLADTLFEDWYSGTMPYRITAADGLTAALAARGDEVTVVVEGVDRIALHATSSDGALSVPAADPAGPLLLAAPAAEVPADDFCFDVFDWGGGVLTLRSARTGRYLTARDGGVPSGGDENASGQWVLTADQTLPNGWDVQETFRLEERADGTELLRHVHSGRYAAVDGATGRVTVSADTPAEAESWRRTVVRDGIAQARAAAAAADTAVVVLGNDPLINGRETQDRPDTDLPPAQDALLRAVAAAQPRTVLVVTSSYPYALDWAQERVPAVLWTAHGGQESGRALAAVLLGASEPTGRLPQTWYRGGDPLPPPLDYDIITAGWTYQYHRAPALYGFGHGLSYTTFGYEDLRLSAARIAPGEPVTATVTVVNTGERAGTETVQLYTRAVDARYDAPLLRLAAFRKVRLAPGERREVSVEVPADALAHWDVGTGAFTVDPGAYDVLVARGVQDVAATARLEVTGPTPAPREAVGVRVAAVDFDACTGLRLLDAGPVSGDAVGPAAPGEPATAVFRDVGLTGARTVAVEVSRPTAEGGSCAVPSRIELRCDGAPLAAFTPPPTADRHTWTELTAPLSAPPGPGPHTLSWTLTGDALLAGFTFAE